jgi:hypothetical protein
MQSHYGKGGRTVRKVKRQLLKVLYATDMPSVLTELGFMTNKAELAYMKSEKGQNELARMLCNAVKEYFAHLDGTASVVVSDNVVAEEPAPIAEESVAVVKEKEAEPAAAPANPDEPEEYAAVRNFLSGLLDHMGVEAEISLSEREGGGIAVNLAGAGLGYGDDTAEIVVNTGVAQGGFRQRAVCGGGHIQLDTPGLHFSQKFRNARQRCRLSAVEIPHHAEAFLDDLCRAFGEVVGLFTVGAALPHGKGLHGLAKVGSGLQSPPAQNALSQTSPHGHGVNQGSVHIKDAAFEVHRPVSSLNVFY